MRMWIAIALGIAVLTAVFVFAQRDRGGEVAAPAGAFESSASSAAKSAQSPIARSSAGQGETDVDSGVAPLRHSGSSIVEPEPRTNPVRITTEPESGLSAEQRAVNRAEGNTRISAANSGSNELNPIPAGGGVAADTTSRPVGIPEADIIRANDPSAISGPLPGEAEPQDYGPLPGEGEPQVYGPLPGENDPQVLGPLPGEGESPEPAGPLPGEG